jgi:hypothetical protein
MKVKENMWERRGRPRSFSRGCGGVATARAEQFVNGIACLRRTGDRSVNDEIIARLLIS